VFFLPTIGFRWTPFLLGEDQIFVRAWRVLLLCNPGEEGGGRNLIRSRRLASRLTGSSELFHFLNSRFPTAAYSAVSLLRA
jgi:hypothetical protein